MEIAPLQRQEIDLLDRMLAHLCDGVGRENRGNLIALRDQLAAWAARISVIGQVKAGKSTFLNAFLHERDFLPSDVNPWTSVVTNIRINIPHDPRVGAMFEFFSEADWDEIINGTSELRDLTERLLPGFDSAVLRRQAEEMRARAQSRLGKYYPMLLGQSHSYEFLNADLMKRYVCAGQEEDTGDAQGRYALITKVANAYMRRPEFKVPVILTDTPGVNDPFLVRDEFTCRSLDQSDIFIVVLSAHQPLTSVDLALIRLLGQQRTKEVLIFINRMDELDDYATEVPRVIEDVSTRLRIAVPEIKFTILAGSAFMAEMATRNDAEAAEIRAALDTPQLHAYVRHIAGYVPEDQIDRLLIASGLDTVKEALSEIIDSGIGARGLSRICEDTRAEIATLGYAMKRERESVAHQLHGLQRSNADSVVRSLEVEITQLSAVERDVMGLIEATDGVLTGHLDQSWASFEADLGQAIQLFLQEQYRALNDQILRETVADKTLGGLRVDLTYLHQAFEKCFAQHFEKSRAGIDLVLEKCLQACKQIISSALDDVISGVGLDDLPHDHFTSAVTFSKKELLVPLVSDRGWAFWRQGTINAEKSRAAFYTIFTAELRPVVQKMVRVFNEAQVERASSGTDRIRALSRMVEVAVAERQRRLRRDRRQIDALGHDHGQAAILYDRLQSQMEILERRLQILSVAQSALSRVNLSHAA